MNTKSLKDKIVLVTGGTGSIGSEIVRQLLDTEVKQIRIYSRDEHKQHELRHTLGDDPRLRYLIGDVRDKERTDYAFRNVDICFHTAALKHVPICEYNPFEAVKTNIIGAQNIISIATAHNLEKVIAISTDKAADPASVLGASKLMMERLMTAANISVGSNRTRFASVRFGNVLHSRGSVTSLWKKQIDAGQDITVTDKNMTRFFMDTSEAVKLVFTALDTMRGGEIFVLKMKSPRKLVDFAKDFIKQYGNGKKIGIKIIGLRPGERLHEVLLTEDEARSAVEFKEVFVILPQGFGLNILPELAVYKKAKKAPPKAYRSNRK